MRAMQEFGKMAIPSSSGRAKRSVQEDGNAIFSRSKKQETPENSEKKEKVYTFSVLLPNGSNLTLLLENPNEEMTVAEFVRTVKRRCEKEAVDMGSRRIQWGNHVYLEDTMGNKLKDKKISLRAALDKITLLILQPPRIRAGCPAFMAVTVFCVVRPGSCHTDLRAVRPYNHHATIILNLLRR